MNLQLFLTAAAALGSVFQVKPILTIQGDKLDAFAKVRGMKKCRHRMAEALQEDLDTRFRNVDRKRLILATAGAGLTEEEAEAWKNEIAEAFPGMEVYYNPLSFSISTHVGPHRILQLQQPFLLFHLCLADVDNGLDADIADLFG